MALELRGRRRIRKTTNQSMAAIVTALATVALLLAPPTWMRVAYHKWTPLMVAPSYSDPWGNPYTCSTDTPRFYRVRVKRFEWIPWQAPTQEITQQEYEELLEQRRLANSLRRTTQAHGR